MSSIILDDGIQCDQCGCGDYAAIEDTFTMHKHIDEGILNPIIICKACCDSLLNAVDRGDNESATLKRDHRFNPRIKPNPRMLWIRNSFKLRGV